MESDQEIIDVHEELRRTPSIWERLAGQETTTATQNTLRKEFPASVVRAALTLSDLRSQARTRFTRADQMWFDRIRLEQATTEIVARHKARRFSNCVHRPVIDLCCGAGADAIAMAEHTHVLATDQSLLATWLTERNAEVYGVADRVQTQVCTAEQISIDHEYVHLDPDRRTHGHRQVRLEYGSPGLPYLQELTHRAEGGAIKVSPASNFGGKFSHCEIELVSVAGECKEATVWFGSLRKASPFRATVLPQGATIAGNPWEYRPRIETLQSYIYDPDPAVVRAGLVDCLAESLGLWRLDDAEEYLTGSSLVESPFIRSFEVLADLHNNTREIRDFFRTSPFGQVEIKCRHMSIDADAIRRKLPLPGSQPGVLLFARVSGKARAIVARRCH